MNLTDVVIEALVDSSFNPHVHEAYAYVINEVFRTLGDCGRVNGFFLAQLDSLDWDFVEASVAKLKE